MKQCQTCQRTYDDDSQSFCIVEGTRLVDCDLSSTAPPPTILEHSPSATGNLTQRSPAVIPYQISGALGLQSGSQQDSHPLGIISFHGEEQKTRSRAGYLLVALIVLVFGAGAGMFAASQYLRGSAKNEVSLPTSAGDSDAEALLSELKALETILTAGSIRGDKAAMEKILADDYAATGADGKGYTKAQTLASTEPATDVTSWSIDGARLLSYSETAATLTGIITYKTSSAIERQQFTDTFVKRDGRWYLLASQYTILRD